MEVKTLREFAQILIQRTKDNFDNVVIVESGSVKGTGKTTFTMSLDILICQLQKLSFELTEVIVFDPTNEKIVERVQLKPDGYPIHIDEASKVAYKRNYAEDSQKKLIVFINICRKHHKIIFVNNPSFWGLDKDLLDLADFRVTILKRGIAIVRGKSKNPESKDKWLRDQTDNMIKKKVPSELDVDKITNALRDAPNYLFEVHFNDIEPKFYKNYEEISKEEELKSFYESSTFAYHTVFEGSLGLLNFLNKYLKEPLNSSEIALVFNNYLRMRQKEGVITNDRIRKTIAILGSIDFEQICILDRLPRAKKMLEEAIKSPIPLIVVDKEGMVGVAPSIFDNNKKIPRGQK